MTSPYLRDTAHGTLLDLLMAAPDGDKPAHSAGCSSAGRAIALLPPAGPGIVPAGAGPAPSRALLRSLGAPLMLAARLVMRRPPVRRMALRLLKHSPRLYARAYRMMMASGGAAPAPGARADTDRNDGLSPRARAILRILQAPAPRAPGARARLAFVSPLPPARTGIAVYAVELLAELIDDFDIELVVAQPEVTLPPALSHLTVRQADWFAEHGGEYDQVLYQIGNSPFHSHMFALLERHPGVAVLHDFFLGGALVHAQMSGADPRAWSDALRHSHGYAAVLASQMGGSQGLAHKDWPSSLPVLEHATRTIVHSRYARQLAADWFGQDAARGIDVIPHPRTPPARIDRAAARAALGIDDDCFLVCSFGFVAPNKLNHELLRAWIGANLHTDRRCALVLAGANHDSPYGMEVEALIRSAGPDANIRIAGWLDDAAYRQYLQAADVGVQLRTNAHGESSGAVLDCMNYGLPTIVNANGSMAEFPPDAVWRLPDEFQVGELGSALQALRRDPALRRAFGERAVAYLDAGMRPAQCARLYRDTLARARAAADAQRQAWLSAQAAAGPADEDALRRLAQRLAQASARPGRRQLLVDVSDWNDGGTPDALARAQLLELLGQASQAGVRVEQVYLDGIGESARYRYARNATARLLGLRWPPQDEPPVDAVAGDVLYAADALSPALRAAAQAGVLAALRARGIAIHVLLRADALAGEDVAARLRSVADCADQLICASASQAQEVVRLLSQSDAAAAIPRQLAGI
ncbi:glycosyltransferase family 4 protein [Massilia sp. 9096]|uniref:glycosyltransferase family 4 protein n=1 Tax=Massilia sp. 9096 TaxID=1500894 RepID=UPI00069073ED|nr:glycosyltransferase family 4 protein [Massilia sp. 9096]